nr:MAG TPA: ABC-type multidrug transport system, ATPase component [Caudoviricetes sp.]
MIEVKNLVKRYGDHVAVNNLSFTVEEGQIYGFLGPNGAGKSTTMNIITGYLASTEGEVLINGHNILEEPEEAKKCIGYLPELPPVYTDMTVLEYLKFVAELKKIPKDQRKKQILEVMNLVKITDMQNRLIKNLSKGYRQRVGLAQAVLGYPPIIILDEPTVGLDPKQIIEIRDLIKSLGKKHTVILSSHILSEVSAVCDYVMIIAKGQLVASDTPENLSKLMLGSNTVTCTVHGTRKQLVPALNALDAKEIQYENTPNEEQIKVKITTEKDKDIREELFYALAKANCPILELTSSSMSLEDVFLELTDDSGKAARKLKLADVPVILYSELTPDEEKDIILRDNINNGDWAYNALQMDEFWKDVDFGFIGLDFPSDDEKPGKGKKKAVKEAEETEADQSAEEEMDDEEQSEEEAEKESFYRSMFKDVLYESDNVFEIPNLLLDMQAGKVELPLSPWGANSRLRKDVATYHFYVDDYRFEALFKDPINLLTSGCKAVVEPNCSCHDQTPVAWGIQLIYKKRWLSRYFQECGIKVYADLNVSHKFIEYNKMGIPKGYNAFFTRGLDGWMESLKSDLQVAQEISGLEKPNLIVYGGGTEIQKFCREHGLLYVTDFINAKKK